jgi:hypothetical protein
VREEKFQTGTQIVLSWIAILRNCETIFRASSIAQSLHLAALALRSERIALVVSEFALCGRRDKLQKVGLVNIAKKKIRFNEMIA